MCKVRLRIVNTFYVLSVYFPVSLKWPCITCKIKLSIKTLQMNSLWLRKMFIIKGSYLAADFQLQKVQLTKGLSCWALKSIRPGTLTLL